ncbi:hypothetical protein C8A05DRAFT_14646 [Staphylotrichum tortipilum]|uniref:F-box domain-containing protein n=1 Tax=Staphylotrichum tortipilum TaxID=2831512 RepID=A0AAN6RTZ7_9PEZI|nr:hypothetical protein C8A05DRAFT_14646 [Staphylotrichum longicolle]
MDGQSPQALNLVSLPDDIRHCIYLHLGIARFDGFPQTFHLNGHEDADETLPLAFHPPELPAFYGLLLSCRILYREAATLLYSANRFTVYYYSPLRHGKQRDAPLSYPGSLERLHALSPTALAALTSLKIVLNECSCHQHTGWARLPPVCCGAGRWSADSISGSTSGCSLHHNLLHRHPLIDPALGFDLISARLSIQAMMSQWRNAAAYMSPRVGPRRLHLSLVCDIHPRHPYALEAAHLSVAPIALFSSLKNLSIRLCPIPDHPLWRVAKEAASKIHGRDTSPHIRPRPTAGAAATTLMSLPLELRLQILECTNLVTPWKEVMWSRQPPGYRVCRPPCRAQETAGCAPHIHQGCRQYRCYLGDIECILAGGQSAVQECFCVGRHAAFSSACHCWTPPTALFLVSRALCREAQFVFFSENRFVVHDFCAMPPWKLPREQFTPVSTTNPSPTGNRYPFDRLAASQFLRDVVPAHCLAHLRFVELVFPPYVPDGRPGDEHAALKDWRATISWARHKVTAPALTVRVVMADFFCKPHGRVVMDNEQGRNILGGYHLIAHPLKDLGSEDAPLAGCYVQPAYPWKHTAQIKQRIRELGRSWLAEMEKLLKKDMEREIQAPRPRSGGGPEPEKSVWQGWYDISSRRRNPKPRRHQPPGL